MRQVIAIGGGGFGRTVKSKLIEKYILDQSPTNKPKVCFVPTATGDSEAYIENFYHVFSKLCCVPSHISFFKRTMDLKLHIEKQDIVFVGGGKTESMLEVWREWGGDKLLEESYKKGTIMCCVMAVAICWLENVLTDSCEHILKFLPFLGCIPGICAPHYDS